MPLERLGYVYRADNSERTKRYFPGAPWPPTNPCARAPGEQLLEQWALLFGDYLRAHPAVAAGSVPAEWWN